ncbi:MAG: hypothetical protein Q7S60_03190 [bacterium]|nr:hypothetical protein [bacterium]
MALGNIFKKQEAQVEHFWSLVIDHSWIEAGIWRVLEGKAEVLARGAPFAWQEGNVETLVEAADGSLSAAVATIGEDIPEPDKVVFGLSPSWVENGSIKAEKLEFLKRLSKDLELKPAGFVVLPEAIVHFLKVQEGAPANTILVGLTEEAMDLSLVQNGVLLGTTEVARSMSLGSDVAEGLARLPQVDQYPSRILLYNHRSSNLDEARQNLIDTEWKDLRAPFLHTPKVEILPEDVSVLAVSLAGGAEVGHATALAEPPEETETGEGEEEIISQEEPKPGQAVVEPELEEVNPEELGFLRGGDIAEAPKKAETQIPSAPDEETQPQVTEEPKQSLPGIVRRAGSFFSGMPKPSRRWLQLPRISLGGRAPGFVGLVVVLLLLFIVGGGVAYWYLPKAEVTIYVAPKRLDKTMTIHIDPALTAVDQGNKAIPGSFVEVAASGEKTMTTTGTKTVGDRAKGQVAIYRVGPSIILPSGTALTGPNSLKFTLDESTQVATGSASAPSQKTASVTASDIGAQHNLASGTSFSVGNFSKDDFEAKNGEAFSGGSSREISAVSDEDRKKLLDELSEELKSKGLAEAKSKVAKGQYLIEGAAVFVVDAQNFSNKAGEEAATLKLNLSGKVKVLVAARENIDLLLISQLEGDVPAGFTLRPDQIDLTFVPVVLKEEKSSKSTTKPSSTPVTGENFDVQITANLLPKLNPQEIAEKIAGKYPSVAKEYLSTIPGFTRASISVSIKLPGKLGTLPRLSRNIVVEVSAER